MGFVQPCHMWITYVYIICIYNVTATWSHTRCILMLTSVKRGIWRPLEWSAVDFLDLPGHALFLWLSAIPDQANTSWYARSRSVGSTANWHINFSKHAKQSSCHCRDTDGVNTKWSIHKKYLIYISDRKGTYSYEKTGKILLNSQIFYLYYSFI